MKTKSTYLELLEFAKRAALDAGDAILDIYENADFGVKAKSDDSPLTIADTKAHDIIEKHLEITNIPVLSEEGASIPFAERKAWNLFWMVDPLDGTKEFIKRNGEFTVNIALIENNEPVLGIVYAPVLKKLYFGGASVNFSKLSFENSDLDLKKNPNKNLEVVRQLSEVRVVASRSYRNKETDDFIQTLKSPKIVSMGSSLKFMVIAEGNADVYPRFAPTMEWDTAAADAVLRGLDYSIYQVSQNSILDDVVRYNKESLLNPHFIAC